MNIGAIAAGRRRSVVSTDNTDDFSAETNGTTSAIAGGTNWAANGSFFHQIGSGGAKIATVNTSDKVLILGPQEAYLRKHNFGTNWNQIRCGIFYTIVPSGNDDAATTAESTAGDNNHYSYFGLKDSSSILPFFSGSKFNGWTPNSNPAFTSNAAGAGAMSPVNSLWTANGVTTVGGSGGGATDVTFGWPIFSTTNVNAFFAMDFTVVNPGASNQSINFRGSVDNTAATDVSISALQAKMAAATYLTAHGLAWNSGGVALALLEYFLFYLPCANNRLRISTMVAQKIS